MLTGGRYSEVAVSTGLTVFIKGLKKFQRKARKVTGMIRDKLVKATHKTRSFFVRDKLKK